MDEDLTVVIGAGRYPHGAPEIAIRGGVEDSLVPSLVLEASILRHAPDTKVISTYSMDKPRMKRKNPTPFSLVRFMVPALCEYRGWAVYCDADQVVFDDIRKILQVVKKNPGPSIYVAKAHGCTGVILMDTRSLKHWDAWEIVKKIDSGAQYGPMMRDLNGHGFQNFGDFGEEWNSRDLLAEGTKLLHYTNLSIQPWKFPGKHPLEQIWAGQLRAAIDENFLSVDTLDENCRKILSSYDSPARSPASHGA